MFGIKLHWGEPYYPNEMRIWTGATSVKKGPWTHYYTTHEVARWYGISYKREWYLGFLRLGKTISYNSSDPPRTGNGSEV